MKKPNESLDDFAVKAEEINIEPPQAVSLRFTGEVEVLKPLAVLDFTGKREAVADNYAPLRLSWFHRSLVAGGAFALGAIVLASAIFIGMYDGPGNESTEVSDVSDVVGVSDVSELPDSEIRNPQSELRNQNDPQSAVRTRSVSRFQRRRQPLRSQYTASDFTPTTLVIFIEKGEIKTRIEPQLANDKKPLTFSN